MVWFFFGQKLVKAAEDARKDHEYRKHLQVKKNPQTNYYLFWQQSKHLQVKQTPQTYYYLFSQHSKHLQVKKPTNQLLLLATL